jgi:hypothetical protein
MKSSGLPLKPINLILGGLDCVYVPQAITELGVYSVSLKRLLSLVCIQSLGQPQKDGRACLRFLWHVSRPGMVPGGHSLSSGQARP